MQQSHQHCQCYQPPHPGGCTAGHGWAARRLHRGEGGRAAAAAAATLTRHPRRVGTLSASAAGIRAYCSSGILRNAAAPHHTSHSPQAARASTSRMAARMVQGKGWHAQITNNRGGGSVLCKLSSIGAVLGLAEHANPSCDVHQLAATKPAAEGRHGLQAVQRRSPAGASRASPPSPSRIHDMQRGCCTDAQPEQGQ